MKTAIENSSPSNQTNPERIKCEIQNGCGAKESETLTTLETKESKETLESYKIAPKHDVFRRLLIPRYQPYKMDVL